MTDDEDADVVGLFEGTGALTTAVRRLLGGRLAAYSEVEPAACRVLAHHYPDVENLGDITQVDWVALKARLGRRVRVTGGFPCTDVSSAGKRAGLTPDTRSGLWAHMARAIHVLEPELVVVENVRGLLSADAACDVEPCPWCLGEGEGRPLRALGAVLGDLSVLGFDARWIGLRAADAGAPHPRFRVFLIAWPAADPGGGELQRRRVGGVVAGEEGTGAGEGPERERDRDAAGDGGGAAADPAGPRRVPGDPGRRRGPEPALEGDRGETVRGGPAEPRRRGGAAPDPDRVGDNGPGPAWPAEGRWRLRPGPADGGLHADADVAFGDRQQWLLDVSRHGLAAADHLRAERAAADPDGEGREGPQPAGRHELPPRRARAGHCVCCGLGPQYVVDVECAAGHPFCEICVGRGHHSECVVCEDLAAAAPDADGDGREGRPERDGDPAPGRDPRAGNDSDRRVLAGPDGVVDWGEYGPAIRRWELTLGRPAPAPTQTGRRGGQQLSPAFVEWMMGLPEGWVTAVPGLSRNEQLKLLGNGVVPAQAELALRVLIEGALRGDAT